MESLAKNGLIVKHGGGGMMSWGLFAPSFHWIEREFQWKYLHMLVWQLVILNFIPYTKATQSRP